VESETFNPKNNTEEFFQLISRMIFTVASTLTLKPFKAGQEYAIEIVENNIIKIERAT